MYQTILFDLDGTLTDPGEGITNSVAYALSLRNIQVEDRRELYRFIGPPLKDSFMTFCEFSESEALSAIEDYRVYFKDRGIFENRPYPGVEHMLKTLKNAGCTISLATSKPEIFARRILEHFQLSDYFHVIAGATMDESRNKKADVIAYALEQIQARTGKDPDPATTLMIGDRSHDILGANAHRLPSLGVLYGYGTRLELEEVGATYIAEEIEEIPGIVLSDQTKA